MFTVMNYVLSAAAMLALAASAHAGAPSPEWSLPTGNVMMSSPRMADITGDGTAEILFATMGPIGDPYNAGSVYVRELGGKDLAGWPVSLTSPITGASLAVGDLDNNGDVEIVGMAWFNLHVWNHDGTPYPGWPKSTGTSSTASPTLADLDNDGDLEIIVPHANVMHVWHHDGTEAAGWPQSAKENLQSASVGDVDGDGALEIVAGTWRAPFPDTVPFQLHMWEADGSDAAGFPIDDLGSVRGPVSLGDIDADGLIEIVARTGDNLQVFDHAGQLEVFITPGGPIRNATPSLGDLDDDGDLEILIGGFDIYAYHHDGTAVAGWPVDVGATGNVNSGIVIASIDDDPNTPEVVVKIANNIVALRADGSAVPGFPLPFSDDSQSTTFSPTPTVGDADGDGDVEYVFASLSGTVAFFDEAEAHNESAAYWPMFEHNPRNTSFMGDAAPSIPGDLDNDGDVDFDDFTQLLASWGDPGCNGALPCPADIDGDDDVDFDDFTTLLANWS